MQCRNCRFFSSGRYVSRCRRNPPIYANGNWAFPTIYKDYWCGEYRDSVDKVCELLKTGKIRFSLDLLQGLDEEQRQKMRDAVIVQEVQHER